MELFKEPVRHWVGVVTRWLSVLHQEEGRLCLCPGVARPFENRTFIGPTRVDLYAAYLPWGSRPMPTRISAKERELLALWKREDLDNFYADNV